ncbi:hypothetical protein AMQ28_10945 [Acinetobacter sp. TTH0-4]|jgi:hypothetical protein|nr:hypothetical protein AMQ28_10945 [Acinetobacter sp. TTH0-4]
MNTISHRFLKYKQSKSEKITKKIDTIINKPQGFKDKLDYFDYDYTWKFILNKKTSEKFMQVHSLLEIINKENKKKVQFP